MKKKGLFFVIDGPDGAGKGTVVTRIKEHFGDAVVTTREPGGSVLSEEVRGVVLAKTPQAKQADGITTFFFMLGMRADHMKNIVRPALNAGKIVVTDRFKSSTWAFNIVAQKAFHLRQFFWTLHKVLLGRTMPDVYIYLYVSPAIGLARKHGQGDDERNRFDDHVDIPFQKAMRKGFSEFFQILKKRYPKTKVFKVNTDNKSKDEVWNEVLHILEGVITKK